MTEIDVFIFYADSGTEYAEAICTSLESKEIRCWYKKRDLVAGESKTIMTESAIKSCTIAVAILDAGVDTTDTEDLKKAFDNNKIIIPFRLDKDQPSVETKKFISDKHWIDAIAKDKKEAIDELVRSVADFLGVRLNKERIGKRQEVPNLFLADQTEENVMNEVVRNKIQTDMVHHFVSRIYDGMFDKKSDMRILDIGTGNGYQSYISFKDYPNVKKIIGVEALDDFVTGANENYGSEKIKFYCADCESTDFEVRLRKIMSDEGIGSFDLINLSFLFLHLVNPRKFLTILRGVLSEQGEIMIIDVDDSLTIGYPDHQEVFSKAIKMLSEFKVGGWRKSGREVYARLNQTGFRDIRLHHNGLNSIGVDNDVKKQMVDTYINLIPNILNETLIKDPADRTVNIHMRWFNDNKQLIDDLTSSSDFFLTVGIMVYTARKT